MYKINMKSALAVCFVLGQSLTLEAAPLVVESTYTYNALGLLATIDGPRTDVSDISSFSYDMQGRLVEWENALGHKVTYANFTERDEPQRVTDENGRVTELTYNQQGLLSSIVQLNGPGADDDSGTDLFYDSKGLIEHIEYALGEKFYFQYDFSSRLTALHDEAGNRIEYVLDAAGNRTEETVYDTTGSIIKHVSRVFDELSRVRKIIGAGQQQTVINYDVNDNPIHTVDPLNNNTANIYDALGRVTRITDAADGVTQLGYSNLGQVTEVQDQRGLVTRYSYDGFGQLLAQHSPDTGSTVFDYDAAGNRIHQIDARGIETLFRYDALNRLLAVEYPTAGELNQTFSYDQPAANSYNIGRLTTVVDPSGRTEMSYAANGAISEKRITLKGVQSTQQYAYDRLGNVVSMTYPSGRVVRYARDSAGQVSAIYTRANSAASEQLVVSSAKYLPFGPLVEFTYGNGLVQRLDYDQDWQLQNNSAVGSDAVVALNYDYDAGGNLKVVDDVLVGTHSAQFSYDNLNRLVHASTEKFIEEYVYDSVGNRLEKTRAKGAEVQVENYVMAQDSNRLLAVQSSGAQNWSKAYSYDENGNRITKTVDGALASESLYSAANRNLGYTYQGQVKASYLYNAFGQRVAKTTENITDSEQYFYSEQGQLLYVSQADHQPLREYIYLDSVAVAMLAPPPKSYAPTAVNDSLVVASNLNSVIATGQLLLNDTDANGDALSISAVVAGPHMSVSLDMLNQSITLIPESGFVGFTSFSYTVSDGALAASAQVSVTVNDVPVGVDDAIEVVANTPTLIPVSILLGNDTDPNGDSLTLVAVQNNVNGLASFTSGASEINFTPTPNFIGLAEFSYRLKDTWGGEATATVSVDVVGLGNQVPTVFPDSVHGATNVPLILQFSALLANDSDADGDAFNLIAVSNPVGGSVTIDLPAETITFTPNAQFTGTASFTYQVTDVNGGSALGNVTISFANTAPVATTDELIVASNTGTVEFSSAVFLANDSDINGDAISLINVSNAVNGAVSLHTGLAMVYFTPASNFTGAASFSYHISDAKGGFATGIVSISVVRQGTAGNDTLTGTAVADIMDGMAGNDTLRGGGGNDLMYGGAGNDYLWGDYGNDILMGDDGIDSLIGGSGDDMLDGGLGADTLSGGSGNDTYLWGIGDGNDVISDNDSSAGRYDVLKLKPGIEPLNVTLSRMGTALKVKLSSGEVVTVDNHFLYSFIDAVVFDNGVVWTRTDIYSLVQLPTSGDDTIYGYNSWNDVLNGGAGNDTMFGYNGTDTLNGDAGNDTLYGGNDNDVLFGGAGNDNLNGEAGNDLLEGGEGYDNLNGGDGSDTYIWRLGDGIDTIYTYDVSAGRHDIVKLVGVAQSEVSFVRTGADLIINLPAGGKITVYSYFSTPSTYPYAPNVIELDDGTQWSVANILTITSN